LKLNEIKAVKSGLNRSLEKGVGVLSNLSGMYERADLSDKKRILSSIFPENLVFDGEKCRTSRINEVLRLILLIDSNKQKTNSGQISSFLDLSAQVEIRGIEHNYLYSNISDIYKVIINEGILIGNYLYRSLNNFTILLRFIRGCNKLPEMKKTLSICIKKQTNAYLNCLKV
jgi:hypothetical protein